jgi:SAM-dependent methyltransferase
MKRRAGRAGDPAARFLLRRAAEDLGDRLMTVERAFSHAATLFSWTEDAREAIRTTAKAQVVLRLEDEALGADGADGAAPFETMPAAPETLDLIVSLYALHEMNDVPGMLAQIRRALRPDGLFLGCMAGAGTLKELRACLLEAETEMRGGASPRVAPLADIRDVGGLLQRAGFALPVVDLDEVTVRYDTMFDLMRDLRAMGAANALIDRDRRPTPRGLFLRAAEIYAERFADPDGRVRATFSTIWMSGWAPHPQQQQPAQRGSARVSLAAALEEPKSS